MCLRILSRLTTQQNNGSSFVAFIHPIDTRPWRQHEWCLAMYSGRCYRKKRECKRTVYCPYIELVTRVDSVHCTEHRCFHSRIWYLSLPELNSTHVPWRLCTLAHYSLHVSDISLCPIGGIVPDQVYGSDSVLRSYTYSFKPGSSYLTLVLAIKCRQSR